MKIKVIKINNYNISNEEKVTLISGPCQIESREHTLFMAENIKKICDKLGINLIFKSSFDKANRTSLESKRGLGLEKSLKIFEEVKSKFNIPVLTDVHTNDQCEIVSKYVDVLQIPAFLCRQTDLLVAAAKT
ncbi:MAG: 3-deoxy-8-phosphooctulonate synthase, partial [Burkholderiaceae bacterium]